jgi:glucokinase
MWTSTSREFIPCAVKNSVLAIDLGGTRIKLGIVHGGVVRARDQLPAQSDQGLAARLPDIAAALRNLCAVTGIAAEESVGIGLSFPSIVDHSTGRVLAEYGKYADAMDLDLRAWARNEFGLPLEIENDARAALMGEWKFGAARGFNDVAMVTLGTGLGTAAIMEGKLVRGRHSQAAVLSGHFTVRTNGRRCSCGNVGCSEAEASTAFLRRIATARDDFQTSRLASEPVIDYEAVFRLAAAGDACAEALRIDAITVWGALGVGLIHAYDPELLIFGGGIMAGAARFFPEVQEYIREHAHTPWGEVRVVQAQLGDDAALLGCEGLVEAEL